MESEGVHAKPVAEKRTTTEILEEIRAHVRNMVRSEIELARTEIAGELRKLLQRGALLAAGALLAVFSLGLALTSGVLLLTYLMPLWIAAALLAAGAGFFAGLLAWNGWLSANQVRLRPEKAIQTARA